MVEANEVWKQGAEARLFITNLFGRKTVIKERFSKGYRHPELDKRLRNQRTKAEVRTLIRCRQNGNHQVFVLFVFCQRYCHLPPLTLYTISPET